MSRRQSALLSDPPPPRLNRVKSLFLRPSPSSSRADRIPDLDAVSDQLQDNRVSFLDLDPNADYTKPPRSRIRQRRLRSQPTSPFLSPQTPPSSFTPPPRTRRRSFLASDMTIGFGTLGRRPKDAPPALELAPDSPALGDARPSTSTSVLSASSFYASPNSSPNLSAPRQKNATPALFKRAIRRQESKASMRSQSGTATGDRASIESSTASASSTYISEFSSDTASSDTSYSSYFTSSKDKYDDETPTATAASPALSQRSNVVRPSVDVLPILPYGVDLMTMDAATEQLLELLRPCGSPSFLPWERDKKPPKRVLAVGTGTGVGCTRWTKAVTTAWPHAKVRRLDVVDRWAYFLCEDAVPPRNVVSSLPFKDNEFDYIRIAPVTFAVPNVCWPNLVAELGRVLASHGRLEIIEEDIVFPMAPPPQSAGSKKPSRAAQDDDDIATSEGEPDSDSNSNATTPRRARSGKKRFKPPAVMGYDREEDYHDMRRHCADMETLFMHTLATRDLTPRAPRLTRAALQAALGPRGTLLEALQVEVHVPSRTYIETARILSDEGPAVQEQAPAPASGKAARLLGLDASLTQRTYTPLGLVATRASSSSATTSTSSSSSASASASSSARLLEMDAAAIDAHATRFARVLAGYGDRLARAFADWRDEDGEPVLVEHDMSDSVWEYQTLHYRRLNMPAGGGGDGFGDDDDPLLSTPPLPPARPTRSNSTRRDRARAGSASSLSTPPLPGVAHTSALAPGEGLTRVRAFRIYSAVKG